MRGMFRYVAAFGLMAALSAPVLAQPGGGGGRGFGPGGGGLGLLMAPGVQEELKLAEEQVAKIREAGATLREKFAADFEALRDASQEERREKMQAISKKMSEESTKLLADVLNADQQKRLKQITLQARGIEAFADEEVQKALKVTEEQRTKLAELASEVQAKRREIMQGAQGDFQAAMQEMRAAQSAALEKAKALLSGDQKKSWSDLIGAPFEIRFGGPGGGRRGGNAN